MIFAITGGGTGGHLAVARAVGNEFAKNHRVIFIGSVNGQDLAWFGEKSPQNPFSETIFLKSRPVVNRRGLSKIFAIFEQIFLAFRARQILKTHKISAVFSVGGFGAGPASLAAVMTRTPLFLHEQNAVFGRLNRFLAKFSTAVFTNFEPAHKDPKIFVAIPINPAFQAQTRTRKIVKNVLFLGGSQGARQINDIALKMAKILHEKGISIAHQTGEKDFLRVKNFYEFSKIPADFFAFQEILPRMKNADICVARAGAGGVFESAFSGLPTIFVPYPFAAGNHQFLNANFLVSRNLAKIFVPRENSSENAREILNFHEFLEIFQDLEADLMRVSQNLQKFAAQNSGGTEKIVRKIIMMVEK